MATSPEWRKALVFNIQRSGPLSPGELMRRLNISQPSLFRLVKSLGGGVLAFGAKRNRKLARPKLVLDGDHAAPVFQVSREGEALPVGQLFALEPSNFALVLESSPSQPRYFQGMPSFLEDVRPKGFFGAGFSRRHKDLGLPEKLKDWSLQDTLKAILTRGEDLPGNLLIGKGSHGRYQESLAAPLPYTEEASAAVHYVALAKAATENEPAGAPLGGNSPKFSALLGRGNHKKNVFVKFAPPAKNKNDELRRDLLLCQQLALIALEEEGILVAGGRILEEQGFTFLEMERFDRTGERGRIRMLSFGSLGAPRLSKPTSWSILAGLLEKEGKIFPEDVQTIKRIEAFYQMIAHAKSDPEDIAFLWPSGADRASLAPAFGLSPTKIAIDRDLAPFPAPACPPELIPVWRQTKSLAKKFWERVHEDKRLSSSTRETALLALGATKNA